MTKKRYIQEESIDLRPEVEANYFISAQHRKVGNPNKTVWTISYEAEVNCFANSIKNEWRTAKNSELNLKILAVDLVFNLSLYNEI